MFKLNGPFWHRWGFPVLSSSLFFAVLFVLFPFDSGYSTVRDPLGWALWSTWTTQSPGAQDYGYCLLVPIMVAYLIYERRREIARTPVRATDAAFALILLGLLVFWIGSRAGKQYIGCAAIQILLAGVIFWFWGKAVFRSLLFTWAILTFAWPLPFIDSAVAFPLRMIVSRLAYLTLNVIGIPCLQSGTALFSPANLSAGIQLGDRFQIDIADPCSGLHSLLPLLMFSAFYSYFFLRKPWHQWTVFLSAIPFTIIGNVCRILMLVIGSIARGPAFAIGTNENPSWFHEGCGFAVFAVVLGLECFLGYLLISAGRFFTHSAEASPFALKRLAAENDPISPTGSGEVPLWRGGILLALAAIMSVVAWNNPPPSLSSETGVLMNLPTEVKVPGLDGGAFLGTDAPVTEAEQTILPKDTAFARKIYDDFHGHNIFFSIVLSGRQQYTIHPPQVCLVAQGWSIIGEEDVPIRLASGHDMVVRNLSIQREESNANKEHRLIHADYMYWYVADGISTPSREKRNWISSWDRVVHNRDHRWAYVIAMSPITDETVPGGLNSDQTRKMLADFIREIVPTCQKSEMSQPGSN